MAYPYATADTFETLEGRREFFQSFLRYQNMQYGLGPRTIRSNDYRPWCNGLCIMEVYGNCDCHFGWLQLCDCGYYEEECIRCRPLPDPPVERRRRRRRRRGGRGRRGRGGSATSGDATEGK